MVFWTECLSRAVAHVYRRRPAVPPGPRHQRHPADGNPAGRQPDGEREIPFRAAGTHAARRTRSGPDDPGQRADPAAGHNVQRAAGAGPAAAAGHLAQPPAHHSRHAKLAGDAAPVRRGGHPHLQRGHRQLPAGGGGTAGRAAGDHPLELLRPVRPPLPRGPAQNPPPDHPERTISTASAASTPSPT